MGIFVHFNYLRWNCDWLLSRDDQHNSQCDLDQLCECDVSM